MELCSSMHNFMQFYFTSRWDNPLLELFLSDNSLWSWLNCLYCREWSSWCQQSWLASVCCCIEPIGYFQNPILHIWPCKSKPYSGRWKTCHLSWRMGVRIKLRPISKNEMMKTNSLLCSFFLVWKFTLGYAIIW